MGNTFFDNALKNVKIDFSKIDCKGISNPVRTVKVYLKSLGRVVDEQSFDEREIKNIHIVEEGL